MKEKRQQMQDAVSILDFETAAIIRDEIAFLEAKRLARAKKPKKTLI
jgi:protein-arginine kinase activator protein McsA